MSRITIDDIAKELGVSKTTVSRSISGKGRVSDETKKKVLEYIRKKDYRPNIIAKSLAKQSTFNIAVVWSIDMAMVDLPYFKNSLYGISEIAGENDYDLLLSMVKGDDISELKRVITNRKVDGVILNRTLIDDPAIAYLKKEKVPFVTMGTCDDADVNQVDNAHFEACAHLTEKLLGSGVKSMALVGGDSHLMITDIRLKGFKEGFRASGREALNESIFLDASDDKSTWDIMDMIMKRKTECILCMDDAICIKVIRYCNQNEIRIPEDIRLGSFYYSSLIDNVNVPVSSIEFDDRALGRRAASFLFSIMEGGEEILSGDNTALNYKVRGI